MGLILLPTYLQYVLVFREMPLPGSSSVTNSPTPRDPLGSFVCSDTEEILKSSESKSAGKEVEKLQGEVDGQNK